MSTHEIKRGKLWAGFFLLGVLMLMPSLAAAQEKIVFASNRDLGSVKYEIYVMNADGTDQKRLTFNTTFDGEASFDGNGGRIVFASSRDGNAEIYVMNADGSDQKRLTNNLGDDGYPCFSNDGTKITFVSNREGKLDVYTMNSDGSNQVRVTNTEFQAFYPSFSPDGNRILYSTFDGNDYEIWIVNVDGTNPVNLTNNSRDDRRARFNPNGTRIIFMSEPAPGDPLDIYVMNADGSNQVNVSQNQSEDGDPSFSPDGNTVVFYSLRSGNGEIWAMTPGGTGAINLSNNASTDAQPAWGTANSVPVLSNIAVSSPINEGDVATLTGEIIDGNAGDAFTISVDWGDGNSETFEYPALTTNFALNHTYVDDPPPGSPTEEYSVTLSVNDHRFGTDVEGVKVKVNNSNPILSDLAVAPSPVVLGNPVTVTGNYTDAGYHGSAMDEQLNVIINWGDGQIKNLMSSGGPGAINEAHQYGAVGNYTITVQVSDNDSGLTVQTLNVAVSPPSPPAAPAGLRVEYIAANRIQLIWIDSSNNEDGFAIESCSQRGCNNFIEIGRTFPDNRAFLDNQLFPNTQYYYRVRAFNVGGYSAYTDVVSGKTLKK